MMENAEAMPYLKPTNKVADTLRLRELLPKILATVILVTVGIIMIKLWGSSLIVSALGSFFLAVGAQVALSAIGINSPFLSINSDDTLKEKPGPSRTKSLIQEASFEVKKLEYAIGAHGVYRHEIEVDKTNGIVKDVLLMADKSSPMLSTVYLFSKLEEIFSPDIYDVSIARHPRIDYEEEDTIFKRFLFSYKKMLLTKDLVVHNRGYISEAEATALVDLGIRLIRLSTSIKEGHYIKFR